MERKCEGEGRGGKRKGGAEQGGAKRKERNTMNTGGKSHTPNTKMALTQY